jgi:hypothetical protein
MDLLLICENQSNAQTIYDYPPERDESLHVCLPFVQPPCVAWIEPNLL